MRAKELTPFEEHDPTADREASCSESKKKVQPRVLYQLFQVVQNC